MNQVPEWKIPKWPFLLGNLLLLAIAATVIHVAHHPITLTEEILAAAVVGLGALLGCVPFYLDYRATCRMIDVNAMTTVAEQMHNLKVYSAQIAAATEQWARVQEVTKGHSEKSIGAAGEIAERMATEIREFNEFQVKLNDTEKGALRLEVEKYRRSEGEWLQVVARILDHIFALHTAAVRSGQPELAEQIGSFQNACRDAARRVGVTPFGVEPNEKFDGKRHRVQGAEKPEDGVPVAGLLAPGMTYQGRLIRHALVRLAGEKEVEPAPAAESEVEAPTMGGDHGGEASGEDVRLED